ncbi:MAG: type II toxin-antitoxin system RelE/ParE family toxin [Proteobacteria bacterium]|nr:type II toxin-antitoxin system RelE/ParE family toxin [Pseudomonadota bacterium]
MAEIRWTWEAERWLRDIHDYIAQNNPIAAQRVVAEIYKKVETLKHFPEIGYKYRDEGDSQIRILLYGHYRIAYFINKAGQTLDIIGVFHGALDIENYL